MNILIKPHTEKIRWADTKAKKEHMLRVVKEIDKNQRDLFAVFHRIRQILMGGFLLAFACGFANAVCFIAYGRQTSAATGPLHFRIIYRVYFDHG